MNEYEFTEEDWHSRHVPVWQRFLEHLSKDPIDYCEIGSFEGRSAIWMLENILTHDRSLATLIDSFEKNGKQDFELEQRFAKNILPWMSKVQVKRSDSFSALTNLYASGQSFDVVYVDGSHKARNVLEDVVLSWRMLRPGGIMICDDLIWMGSDILHERPEMALKAFLEIYGPELVILDKGVQLIVRKI